MADGGGMNDARLDPMMATRFRGYLPVVVDVETDESFAASRPRVLFEKTFRSGIGVGYEYDIAPDGQRFVVIKEAVVSRVANQLHFVDNWFTELERLVPTTR